MPRRPSAPRTRCLETREAALIDATGDIPVLLGWAKDNNFKVTKILLTHEHWDHIVALKEAVDATDAPVHLHADGLAMYRRAELQFTQYGIRAPAPPAAESIQTVKEGDDISVGSLSLRVMHTPGHAPG